MKKRGLTEVISVVLLIAIVIVIAFIIFYWAKNFIVALGPAGTSCEEINFEAGVFEDNLDIINRGNIDLYGFVIKELKEGEVKIIAKKILDEPVSSGNSISIEFAELSNIEKGSNLLIIPLVSEATDDTEEVYTCPDEFGVDVEV